MMTRYDTEDDTEDDDLAVRFGFHDPMLPHLPGKTLHIGPCESPRDGLKALCCTIK